MKNTLLKTALTSLGAGLLFAGTAMAQNGPPPLPGMASARFDVPVDVPGIPAYVRIENAGFGWMVPRDGQWTALVFYRDPNCIPLDFNLLNFFDFPGPNGPGAFGCPLLLEGTDLYFGIPDPTTPPTLSHMRNRTPAHPIWFVDSGEFDDLLAGSALYLDQIEALPSLVRAAAWHFEERLYPGGSNPEPGLTMSAFGRLESGGQFSLFWHSHPSRDENVVDLRLEIAAPTPPPAPPVPRQVCLLWPTMPMCQ